MWCNFLLIYDEKSKFDRSSLICKETFLKACGSLRSGAALTFSTQKMNHVAYQLIFEIISAQKFSILVLKFKDFLKNNSKCGFAQFLGPYSSKTAFINIHKVKYAQSWTALFRAFSSDRQPSVIFSKVFPAEQTSWPNWLTLRACTEADA